MNRGSDAPQCAFEEQLRPHDEALKRYCEHLWRNSGGHPASSGEDVWQEAKAKAWQKYALFERGTNFRAWLFRIAKNAFLDTVRWVETRKDISYSMPVSQDETGLSPEERFGDLNTDPAVIYGQRAVLESALEQLSVRERSLVRLHYYEGLSYRECAQMLKLKPTIIPTTLQRARMKLRDILGPQLFRKIGMGVDEERKNA